MPVVPCALLAQDYFRIAGHKPKEWQQHGRHGYVIRVQDDAQLAIHADLLYIHIYVCVYIHI